MGSSERTNCFVDVLEKVMGSVCGKTKDEPRVHQKKILGKVVLVKKNVLDVTDVGASVLDRVHEIFGKDITFSFISATHCDPENRNKGKLGKEARLVDWVTKLTSLEAEDSATFELQVEWDESMGVPGAFIVKNHHFSQFYLKSVTLENVHEHGQVHFDCNSWVYPAHRYSYDRIFFSNKIYLPCETPEPLRWYRDQELINLRGNGKGALREWDRVYDYAYYNDLGSPERGEDFARPVLGGTKEYPYPRRGRTGRRPNKKDPKTESRLPLLSLDIYVPRDERFSSVKLSDFIAYALKSVGQVIGPEIRDLFDKTRNEFDTFEDVLRIYDNSKEVDLPDAAKLLKHRKSIPWELVRELARSDGERFLKFPMPEVIQEDKTAWRTDEEFGREMLAGVNPVIIRSLKEFPTKSNLDRQVYGNQDSTIKREHIEEFMNGLTVDEAIRCGKLYILDHHDALMLYLRRINTTNTKTYATRTVLLLQDDGTLKPLAIELSLPHVEGDQYGAISEVFTPCDEGVEGALWQLAKAYAAVNDSGYHQLISHFLNTHAVIEPFLIATHRQLSVMHPINKLLHPHFRDTMYINALARQILINAGGVLENTVFPSKYAMEMSSAVYKSWNFNDQALPQDLINRGMAVKAESKPHGLHLMIQDYPYAVDGLEIWSAIESWVREYCSIYYPTDDNVRGDSELQSWWTEVRTVGHGDLKDEPWWPKMHTREELVQSCTIIIWIASALHAAVNFGQYPFAGYLPNRPTVSRRFMPKKGTPEFAELEKNPDGVFFKTITAQFQTLLGISLIEILSRHSSDEIYLGQRDSAHWTGDKKALEAFERFASTLMEVEEKILQRNKDSCLKNRTGPVKMDYMLLFPNTSGASQGGGFLTKGIPNSISI